MSFAEDIWKEALELKIYRSQFKIPYDELMSGFQKCGIECIEKKINMI